MDFLIQLIISGILITGVCCFCVKKIISHENKGKFQIKTEIDRNIEKLLNEKKSLEKEIETLQIQQKTVVESIDFLKEQAEDAGKTMYDQAIDLAKEKFEKSSLELRDSYIDYEEDLKAEYQIMLEESVKDYNEKIAEKVADYNELKEKFDVLLKNTNAAVEAHKRQEQIKADGEYYRLQLSKEDLDEIGKLKEVAPYLRDSAPLNKVIWKVYYEKPFTDLIGRVVGDKPKTGIYKITNIENKKCYVGQSKNISDRFKQHIKRGLGAETPTKNKLYPAMAQFGVENFTFEVIEECSGEDLDKQEDFWQEYFHAKDFGYSIK